MSNLLFLESVGLDLGMCLEQPTCAVPSIISNKTAIATAIVGVAILGGVAAYKVYAARKGTVKEETTTPVLADKVAPVKTTTLSALAGRVQGLVSGFSGVFAKISSFFAGISAKFVSLFKRTTV